MCTYQVEYIFTFPDGKKEHFHYCFNENPFELVHKPIDNPPGWIKLAFYQCENCSLKPDETAYCPQALSLLPLIRAFNHLPSYEPVHIEVVTQNRVISQNTTVAKGVSSLMGLLIATCGCPATRFFIPMGRFHLPLASHEETLFRAAATFLLNQYYLKKDGHPSGVELDGLLRVYKEIQTVNQAMLSRLRAFVQTDSSVNALILLDVYAKFALLDIDECMEEIRYLFKPFLESFK